MDVHLIDGTYELFRHFFAVPSSKDSSGQEIGAVRGVLTSVLSMLEAGSTHVGVATDHVVESFRNNLYLGYKTAEGVDPELLSQFPILEEGLQSMGVLVWPETQFEADDALASAAAKAALDDRVRQVFICTPDKDLGQSVRGTRVVQLDRRRQIIRDEAAVEAKFGVKPESIPDYLALVGDAADGYPGLKGWGEKAAAAMLSRYIHLENIPRDCHDWPSSIRGAARLSQSLFSNWDDAILFRVLATLRLDVPIRRGGRSVVERAAPGLRSILRQTQSARSVSARHNETNIACPVAALKGSRAGACDLANSVGNAAVCPNRPRPLE